MVVASDHFFIQQTFMELPESSGILRRRVYHSLEALQHKTSLSVNYAQHIFIEHYSLKEKAMAPHSSTLAWKIPWTEEPGRLQSMGS